METELLVTGGDGFVGEVLAEQLTTDLVTVMFLSRDERAVKRATEAGADARVGNPSEAGILDRENVEEIGTAVVASLKDSHNLLAAQLLLLRGAERVIALVNDPKNVEAFAAAGIEPVSASTALAGALDRQRRVVEHAGRSSKEETTNAAKRHQGYEESIDEPEDERVRSDGAGGDT